VTFNSTDVAGDIHNVAFPFLVECTYSLTNPTFTPQTTDAAASFAITVNETAGGSNCPWTAKAGGQGGLGITSGSSGIDTAVNTGTAVNFPVAPNLGTTAENGSIIASYFAANTNLIGTSTLKVTLEPSVTAPNAISGGSTTQNVAVTQSGAGAASIQFTSPCGALDSTGNPDPLNNNFGITCTAPATPLPASGGVPVTINVPASATANLRPAQELKSSAPLLALGFAAFGFALPGIVFLGVGATAFGSKKHLARRGLFRLLSLLLMISLIALLAGCGGGFSALVVPKGSANTFSITVMGAVSDGSGQVTGIEVYTISVPVTPQI
jgi:hypothetical protein